MGGSLFFLWGFLYSLVTLNWRIEYDQNGFTYRNLWRRKRRFSYSDITEIKRGKSIIRMRAANKRLWMDATASLGIDGFFQEITRVQILEKYHSQIPKARKKRKKLNK